MNPLPLVDGCLLIDNSSIEKFNCARRWQHSEIDLRSQVAEKAGANFGSTMHRGWETRYKLCGTRVPMDAEMLPIETAMHEWLDANPQPPGEFRNFDHACKVMRVYNQQYPQETFKILETNEGKPIIESSFMLPFAFIRKATGEVLPWTQDFDKVADMVAAQLIPVYYCGKIDLGIEDQNGIWAFDHKTAFMFGDSWIKQMSMDAGQLGYVWALGRVYGTTVMGYVIDGVRIRRPSVKSQFTGEAPIDGTDFCRLPFYVTSDQLQEWQEDTQCLIQDIYSCYIRSFFPRRRSQCIGKYGPCEFFDVCSTPRNQREVVLSSGLYEENKWAKGLRTE